MKKLLLLLTFVAWTACMLPAQCNLLPNAVQDIILDYQSTNLANCTGVAFNPTLGLYYGVRAGNSSFPLETWTSTGGQLYSTTAGFDWRGMWWNPNLGQLEGNGYASSGIWRCNLDASGYAINTGTTIFGGQNQPDAQSVGDYDYVNNEIIYYLNGSIYRYSRATNAFLGTIALTGTPVALSNLNNNTAMYTGCAGKEFALLDYVNKRVYMYQRSNGAYVGMSQLPAGAVTTSSFRTSWANGMIWLFDLGTGNWVSFRVFDTVLPQNSFQASAEWMGEKQSLVSWESGNNSLFERFEVERSLDGSNFSMIGAAGGTGGTQISGSQYRWELPDSDVPNQRLIYYRVKAILKSGETQVSETLVLNADNVSSEEISLWPQPADDNFRLRLSPSMKGAQYQCFDASGRLVHASAFESAADYDEINCQTWAKGIYILRVNQADGKILTKRLVVQH